MLKSPRLPYNQIATRTTWAHRDTISMLANSAPPQSTFSSVSLTSPCASVPNWGLFPYFHFFKLSSPIHNFKCYFRFHHIFANGLKFRVKKFSSLDGLDLKREKEQAIKMKKKKTYNEQEEIESQRRLQEQLQNIEPPHCGPKFMNVSGVFNLLN